MAFEARGWRLEYSKHMKSHLLIRGTASLIFGQRLSSQCRPAGQVGYASDCSAYGLDVTRHQASRGKQYLLSARTVAGCHPQSLLTLGEGPCVVAIILVSAYSSYLTDVAMPTSRLRAADLQIHSSSGSWKLPPRVEERHGWKLSASLSLMHSLRTSKELPLLSLEAPGGRSVNEVCIKSNEAKSRTTPQFLGVTNRPCWLQSHVDTIKSDVVSGIRH